jgi:hypothetical protein
VFEKDSAYNKRKGLKNNLQIVELLFDFKIQTLHPVIGSSRIVMFNDERGYFMKNSHCAGLMMDQIEKFVVLWAYQCTLFKHR